MSRYSYDDMPPEGYRERRGGGGKMTAAIASIGVLLTLIAIIIYLLFTPHDESADAPSTSPETVAVELAEPEIIESRGLQETPRTAAPAAQAAAAVHYEKASDGYDRIEFSERTVKEGDTLTGIADEYSLSYTTLVSVNKLTDTELEPGTVLKIPPMNGTLYTVGAGDTLESIAEIRNPELTAADLAALNGKEYTAVRPGDEIFIPAPGTVEGSASHMFRTPVPGGEIIARFGDLIDGKALNGIVIASGPGTAVTAAADGTVVDIFFHPQFGRSITLLHDNGYSTDYYALEAVAVKMSQRVEQGDVIGAIGTSNGFFHKPAVVFCIEQNSVPLDPMNLTEF